MKVLFALVLLTIQINLVAQYPIKAGAAIVNITPPYGTIINGDFIPMNNKFVHDSLYARALALDNGRERFAFVVVDCTAMDGDLISDIKKLINKQLGLKPSQIMISSTHAHSCGAVIDIVGCPADLKYRLSLPSKIASSVLFAFKSMKPAQIAWGKIDVPAHVSCRRWFMKPGFTALSPFGDTDKVWMNPVPGSEFLDHPVSPTDPEVSYLAIIDYKNNWVSILANYSTHYVGDIPESTISADYFGVVGSMLKLKLNAGNDFVGIMSNGTSGDVNTWDFKMDKGYPKEFYQKTDLITNDITDSILASIKDLVWEDKPVFKFASSKVKVEVRQPSEKLVASSKKIVQETNFRELNTLDKASNAIARIYANQVVNINEYSPKFFHLPLQAIKIGKGTIGTLPGEFFSETGLKLKKNPGYKFTICLANDYVGYVPPKEQFALGGYETWLGTGSHLEIEAETKIYNSLKQLVNVVLK